MTDSFPAPHVPDMLRLSRHQRALAGPLAFLLYATVLVSILLDADEGELAKVRTDGNASIGGEANGGVCVPLTAWIHLGGAP